MSGLAEAQQLFQILQEIDALLKGMDSKAASFEGRAPAIKENVANFRQLERLALRFLAISKRMGLPEEVGGAIDKISQVIVMIRMAQIAISMLELSNPVTFLIGVAGMASVGFASYDLIRGGS